MSSLTHPLAILRSLGFVEKSSVGSHHKYTRIVKGREREITVDYAIDNFDAFLIKSMISQSGFSRFVCLVLIDAFSRGSIGESKANDEEFYCATKKTARKIGRKRKQ